MSGRALSIASMAALKLSPHWAPTMWDPVRPSAQRAHQNHERQWSCQFISGDSRDLWCSPLPSPLTPRTPDKPSPSPVGASPSCPIPLTFIEGPQCQVYVSQVQSWASPLQAACMGAPSGLQVCPLEIWVSRAVLGTLNFGN